MMNQACIAMKKFTTKGYYYDKQMPSGDAARSTVVRRLLF